MTNYDAFYDDLKKLLPEKGTIGVVDKKSIQDLEEILTSHFCGERLEQPIVRYFCKSSDKNLTDFWIKIKKNDNSTISLRPKDFKSGSTTLLNKLSNLKVGFSNDILIIQFWNQVLEPRSKVSLTDREISFLDQWFSFIHAQNLSTKETKSTLRILIEQFKTRNKGVWNDYYIPHAMKKEEIFGYIFSTNRLPFLKEATKYNLGKEFVER